jgi:hypothetical protein
MIPTTSHTSSDTPLLLPAPAIRPTAETPPPTTGGLEAFESWLIDRLCELEAQFESYVTETSSRFRHDRR